MPWLIHTVRTTIRFSWAYESRVRTPGCSERSDSLRAPSRAASLVPIRSGRAARTGPPAAREYSGTARVPHPLANRPGFPVGIDDLREIAIRTFVVRRLQSQPIRQEQ